MAIEQLNDLCNHCVIPVGRHTFMAARWGHQSFSRQPDRLCGTPRNDPAEYQLALKRQLRRNMRIWSERIDRVTRFGMQITATHIGEIASTHTFGVNKRGMPLRAYLRSCTRTQRSRLRCFQALGLEFLAPYQIIQRVAVTIPLPAKVSKHGNADPKPTLHAVTWQSASGHHSYGLAYYDDLQRWQQLEQAVHSSANWKQFRQACPARHRQPVCRAFRRAGVPAPHDQQPFLMDDLPTDVSNDWRPRPAQAMLEWMPAFLVEEFGTVIENGFESASVQFSEQELRHVARILETRYGYRVVRNEGGPLQLPLGR